MKIEIGFIEKENLELKNGKSEKKKSKCGEREEEKS